MPDFITIIYLALMFIALYFFFFYILLIFRNKHKLFYYPEPEKNYTVSFIIPAYNEQDTIENTVNAIMDLDYKAIKELIIINDGSKDNTLQVMKKHFKKRKKLHFDLH